jgi:D-alanyl-D-alanine carboxypeptidase
MRTFLFFVFLFLSVYTIKANNHIDSTIIRSTIDAYREASGFSGTILVAKKGQPVFFESYGLAYYSTPDPIQNDYHYSIASVTKLFTSIRILQLQEEGKVALDQPIIDYLPQFVQSISKEITIHHLLLHISGLPVDRQKMYRHAYTPTEMVEETLTEKPKSDFGQFYYNNIDYVLLGLIIEAVTGSSWQENISQHILEPLQLKQTGFLEYGYYPENFAYTYSVKRKKLKQDPLFYIENFYAAGNMYASAMDLLTLDQALYANTLLNENSKALLLKSYPEYNYTGYGVWNYQYPFIAAQPTIMERRGGILGANVVLVRMVEENYTIIILSNDNRFNPDSFGDDTNLREMLIRTLYGRKAD